MWVFDYHHWAYDANFLPVRHRDGVQNDRKRVEWDMNSEMKAAKMEENLDDASEKTTG